MGLIKIENEAAIEENSTEEISPTGPDHKEEKQIAKTEASMSDDESSSDGKENENALSDKGSDREDADEDSQQPLEEETQEDLAEIEIETNKLLNDINYGTVLSYFDKFSAHLALKNFNVFKNFEASITPKKNLNRKFIEFHISLLKNFNFSKHIKRDRWEFYLAKYINKFSKKDSSHLEKSGYLNYPIEKRLFVVKNLLESQFDENSRLKQAVAEKYEPEEMRVEPIGYDKTGLAYWYFMDPECAVRLFTSKISNEKSWKIIAKTKEEIRALIDELADDPEIVKLRSSSKYKKKMEHERKLKEEAARLKLEQEEKELLAQQEQEQEAIAEKFKLLKSEEENTKETEIKTENVKLEVNALDKELFDDEIEDEKKQHKIEISSEEDESKTEVQVDSPVVEEMKGEKEETIEVEIKKEEEGESDKGVHKDSTTPRKIVDDNDYNEPIAYRRSCRSAVKKVQEIQQLQKQIEIVKKQKIITPKKKTIIPANKKKPLKKSKKPKNGYQKESEDDSEEDSDTDDDIPLSNISKITKIENQDKLLRVLEEKLVEVDQATIDLEQRRIREKAEKAEQAAAALKESESLNKKKEVDSDQEANDHVKSEQKKKFFCDDEPVGPRSCRIKNNITYTFEEYDRNINKAVGIPDRSGRQMEAVEYIPRSTRRTRNNKIGYDFDSYEGEVSEDEDDDEDANVSKRSNDSEFKVKSTKKKTSDYSDDDEEEEEEDDYVDSDEEVKVKAVKKGSKKRVKGCSDSDESFKVSRKSSQKKVSKKKSKVKSKGGRRSSSGRGRRGRSNRYEDTDEEEVGSAEELSDESSDEDEKIARYNSLFVEERRSTRTRKCITETYCEEGEDSDMSEEVLETRKGKRKKRDSSDDTFDEDEDLRVSKREQRKSAVKKPWLDDESNSEGSDPESDNSEKETLRRSSRPTKSVVKKPWSDDDDEEENEAEDKDEDESDDEEKVSKSEESKDTNEKDVKKPEMDKEKQKINNVVLEQKREDIEKNNELKLVEKNLKLCDKLEEKIIQTKPKISAEEVIKKLDESISEYSSDGSSSPGSPASKPPRSPKPDETKNETNKEIPILKQPESTPIHSTNSQTLQTYNVSVTVQQPVQQPQSVYPQPIAAAQFPNAIYGHQQPTIQPIYFNPTIINNGMPVQNCFNPGIFTQQVQPHYYDQMSFQQQFMNGQQMMLQGSGMQPPGSQQMMMPMHPQQGMIFNPGGIFSNQRPGLMQPGLFPIVQNGPNNNPGSFNQPQNTLFQPHLGI